MKKDCKIFIIEPERIIALELQLLLEKNGYSVFQPHHLSDIKMLDASSSPNLIILDINKGLTGNQEQITKILSQPNLSVICISTDQQKMKEKEYHGANIIGVFLKPFDSKGILTLVDEYYTIKSVF
ncbi:MAG: response regulator [Bacteroidota bacterium]